MIYNIQTLLVADEQAVVRKGIIASIKNDNTAFKILEASGLESMEELLGQNSVSHLILSDGLYIESINSIRHLYPGAFVMLFSAMSFALIGETLLKAGTSGYLSRQATAPEMEYGINHFLQYGSYLPASIGKKKEEDEVYNPFSSLSDRELVVAGYLLQGLTVKEIAGKLNLSVSAVSTYKIRMQGKLHVDGVVGMGKMASLFSFSV